MKRECLSIIASLVVVLPNYNVMASEVNRPLHHDDGTVRYATEQEHEELYYEEYEEEVEIEYDEEIVEFEFDEEDDYHHVEDDQADDEDCYDENENCVLWSSLGT
jgi:hypothetical protein